MRDLDEKKAFISKKAQKSGLGRSHLCGRMMFFWVNSLINLGRKKYLDQDDIFDLRERDTCVYNYNMLKQNWLIVQSEAQYQNPLKEAIWRTFKKKIIWLSVLSYLSQIVALSQALSTEILLDALQNDILGELLVGMGMVLFSIVVSNILENWYQFEYVNLKLIIMPQVLFQNLYVIQSSGALNMLIVNQTLNFPLIRSSFYKLGDFLNMIQVDINQISGFFRYYILIFITPVLLALAMTFSFMQLGSLFVIPAAGSILQVILGLILGVIYGRLQRKFMHGKDLRMRYLDEMMVGAAQLRKMKIQFFFTFLPLLSFLRFSLKIKEKRTYQLKRLFKEKLMTLVIGMVNGLMAITAVALTCLFYDVDGSQLIFIMSLNSILSATISTLPEYITTLVVGYNSIQRMQPFLLAQEALRLKNVPEGEQNNVYENVNLNDTRSQQMMLNSTSLEDQDKAIEVNNGNFQWLEAVSMNNVQEGIKLSKQQKSSFIAEKFSISDLNFNIKKGECVAFVGEQQTIDFHYKSLQIYPDFFLLITFSSVGSGKSSIFYALLGEMVPTGSVGLYDSMVQINGSLSVSTQDPWIMQGSVKENITFGQQFNYQKYRQVIRFSGLEHDIRQFPDSDMTVIGEKGDTISGGQKKRINLARTLYNDADIYILDDPLSALDVKVASYVMREGILGYLREKTRIIFSGSLDHLQKVDRIYYIEGGKIINIGNYTKIKLGMMGSAGTIKSKDSKDDPQQDDLQVYPMVTVTAQSNRELSEKFATLKEVSEQKTFLVEEDKKNGSVNRQIHFQLWIKYGHFFTLSFLILCFAANLYSFQFAMSNFNKFNNLDDQIQQQVKNQTREKGYISPEEYKEFRGYEINYCLGLSATSITTVLSGLMIFSISIRLSKTLHDNIVVRLLQASFPKFYNLILKGRLLNRLSQDIFNVDSKLPESFLGVTSGIFTFVQFTFYFIKMGQILMYPLFFVQCLLSLYIIYLYMRTMRELVRIQAVSKSPILAFYTELVRGAIYLRNCVSRTFLMENHATQVETDLQNQISLFGVNCWFNLVISMLNMTSTSLYMLVAVIICSFDLNQYQQSLFLVPLLTQFFDPQKQSSDITSVVILTSNVTVAFLQISRNFTKYQVSMINFERCLYMQNEIPIELENEEVHVYGNQGNQKKTIDQQSKSSTKSTVIEFCNTSLRYRDNIPPVLSQVDLKIKEQQKIGIVGRTGAGQTSLTLGIARIIDIIEGMVLLRDKDIRNYNLKDLRNSFAVIPQDPFVFQGTLRDNLDPLKRFTDDELSGVMKETGLDQCSSFKAKLRSSISQLGGNLSAGEKQLVSIACALLKKCEIIMIDEASATMDEESEEQVMKAIQKSFKNYTVITIAHKIQTILNSDKIAVIDSGAVLQFDTPKNLMENPNSVFSSVLQAMEQSCGIQG